MFPLFSPPFRKGGLGGFESDSGVKYLCSENPPKSPFTRGTFENLSLPARQGGRNSDFAEDYRFFQSETIIRIFTEFMGWFKIMVTFLIFGAGKSPLTPLYKGGNQHFPFIKGGWGDFFMLLQKCYLNSFEK
jgi:hypothetical protein